MVRSASTNYRENGINITILKCFVKLTLAGVEKQNPHLFTVDLQVIDNLSGCCAFRQLSVFFNETTFTKEGKELNSYFQLLAPVSGQ